MKTESGWNLGGKWAETLLLLRLLTVRTQQWWFLAFSAFFVGFSVLIIKWLWWEGEWWTRSKIYYSHVYVHASLQINEVLLHKLPNYDSLLYIWKLCMMAIQIHNWKCSKLDDVRIFTQYPQSSLWSGQTTHKKMTRPVAVTHYRRISDRHRYIKSWRKVEDDKIAFGVESGFRSLMDIKVMFAVWKKIIYTYDIFMCR